MMYKLCILLCLGFFSDPAISLENASHALILARTENPCLKNTPLETECEVRVEVPLTDDKPMSKRDATARARDACEALPFKGKKRFVSREADGDGLIYFCKVSQQDFLQWWISGKKE